MLHRKQEIKQPWAAKAALDCGVSMADARSQRRIILPSREEFDPA